MFFLTIRSCISIWWEVPINEALKFGSFPDDETLSMYTYITQWPLTSILFAYESYHKLWCSKINKQQKFLPVSVFRSKIDRTWQTRYILKLSVNFPRSTLRRLFDISNILPTEIPDWNWKTEYPWYIMVKKSQFQSGRSTWFFYSKCPCSSTSFTKYLSVP